MTDALARVMADVPALRPVLQRARAKFVSRNGVAGTVALTEAEAGQMKRIGCHVPPKRRVKLTELDRALRESSIGAGLEAVLEAVGGPLVTREQASDRRDALWRELRTRLLRTPVTPEGCMRVTRWLEADSRHLELLSHQQQPALDESAINVARALDGLPGSEAAEPLARFAARVSGNAHTFDEGEAAGRLLLRALTALGEGDGRRVATREEREDVLAGVGLLLDDLSSDVLLIGFLGGAPYVDAATRIWHPIRLPLYVLDRMGAVRPANSGAVFAVENPAVFRILMDRASELPPPRRPALVCTSGHLSLAVRRLLDSQAEQGRRILYSGDFDARGVEIALRLRDRHPHQVELWRMTPADHAAGCAVARPGPGVDDASAARLAAHLPELAACLRQATVHQETLIEHLWGDVQAVCTVAPAGSASRQP